MSPPLDSELARWSPAAAPEPGALLGAPVPAALIAAMAQKYAAIDRALGRTTGLERAAALRGIAAAFPGALREAQLTAPAVLAARARWCAEASERPWSAWRVEGREAVPLWAAAHRLLADVLAARAGHSGRIAGAAVHAWLAAATPELRGRWPRDPARLAELATPHLRSRSALLWLGCWAGLPLDGLGRAMFDRSGHWDARPDDPAWARQGPDP